MADKLTRQEIEQRLGRTSESISRRVGALERAVRPRSLGSAARSVVGPQAKIVSVLAAGLAVGWVLAGIGRRVRRRRRTAETWTEGVVEEVLRERDRGTDEHTALRRALRHQIGAMPHSNGDGGGGLLSFVLGYAVRTGLQALVASLFGGFTRQTQDGGDSGDA